MTTRSLMLVALLLVVGVLALAPVGCGHDRASSRPGPVVDAELPEATEPLASTEPTPQTPAAPPPPEEPPMITLEQAIELATTDATRVYKDMSLYEPTTTELDDGWKIEFVLKNKDMHGGGGVYEIGHDGTIRSKKYYQ